VRRGREVLIGLSLATASLALALALGEGMVRLVAPQPTKVSVPAIIDPDLIYRLPAHARGTDVKEEFAVTITTNALGLRDRDYPPAKPPGVRTRLLVLGDSMTFAEGVEAEETYPEVLEATLAARHGAGRYEVINAAVRGYGNDQQLVLFERLAPAYRPDVVLLAFFAVNDVDDNLRGGLFSLEAGRLVRQPLSEATSPKYRYYRRQSFIQTFPGYQTLVVRSHLANLARRTWVNVEHRRAFGDADGLDPAAEARGRALTRAILAAWIARARALGVRPLFVLIPSWAQVHTGRDDAAGARDALVAGLARELDVPLVAPLAALAAAARAGGRVYYPRDRHMTVDGHRVVARVLERCLARLEIVPAAPDDADADACRH
jgi:hypothetical protein